jgi:hypothetical protein
VKTAPSGQVDRAWNIATGDRLRASLFNRGIWNRGGRKQALRIWMKGLTKHFLSIAKLDDLAQIHHSYCSRHLASDSQIMGYEQQGQAKFVLKITQQIENLSLHRYVERADRLIGHDEFRIQRKSPRDCDALTLTTAKCLWKLPARSRRQPNQLQQLSDSLLAGSPCPETVCAQRLVDTRPHC